MSNGKINYPILIKLIKAVDFIKKLYQIDTNLNDANCGYILKVDGYYFCEKRKTIVAVIRVRYKRKSHSIPLHEIINNRLYLTELHPLDVFFIGVIANNERNGIVEEGIIGWKKMVRLKDYRSFVKIDPILYVSSKYYDSSGSEIVVLCSRLIKKEITISISDLCENLALICAVDGFHAISMGYDVSESYIRSKLSKEINE